MIINPMTIIAIISMIFMFTLLALKLIVFIADFSQRESLHLILTGIFLISIATFMRKMLKTEQ
ncbi:MAG: hypothetical protein D6735_00705 [Acidobacteria bacterium]|nr:MAG: hypothetical protein D6735_00705 [Acidobacteriota bacterium]